MILKASAANGSLVLRRPLDVVPGAGHRPRGRRHIRRRRQVVHHRVQQGLDALVLEGRPAHHGEDLPLHRCRADCRRAAPSSAISVPSTYAVISASSVSAIFSTQVRAGRLCRRRRAPQGSPLRGTARPGRPRPRSAPSCVTRSTSPENSASLPMGIWMGTAFAPSLPCISCTTSSKRAPTLSILLMNATRGTL